MASVDGAFVGIGASARAASSVSLANSATIPDRAEQLDGGVDPEVGLRGVALGEEDIKVVGVADGQSEVFEFDGSI